MSPLLSIYLDIVRFASACFVVYAHANVRFLLPDVPPLVEFAHSAVTVFFVLSGYVIAFVSGEREHTWHEYVASRASRILPLSVLAVVLTVAADSLGRSLVPTMYGHIPGDSILLRMIISLGFLNEVWFVSVMPFSNVPYWSLTYEVWYYALFGLAIFARGWWRTWGLLAVCLAVGPKILLMLPCWLLGVWAFRTRIDNGWSRSTALAILLASLVAFWLYHRVDLMRMFSDGWLKPNFGEWLYVHLTFSHYFAADWVLSIVVALNFLAARRLFVDVTAPPEWLRRAVNKVGALTFALYIFHYPLLYVIGALTIGVSPSFWKWSAVIAATCTIATVLGVVGEVLRKPTRSFLLARLPPVERLVVRLIGQFQRQAPTNS